LTQSEFPQVLLPGITGSPFSCIGVVKSEAYLPCQGRQAPIFVVRLALQDSQKSFAFREALTSHIIPQRKQICSAIV
jgi:hypothetical protein